MALGAYQVAYSVIDEGRYQGPYPTQVVEETDGQIDLIFEDGNVTLIQRASNGFEVIILEKDKCMLHYNFVKQKQALTSLSRRLTHIST